MKAFLATGLLGFSLGTTLATFLAFMKLSSFAKKREAMSAFKVHELLA